MRVPSPNFTQIPNDLFDYWLPHLGEVELKVLLVIMRKTFGWHRTSDMISISQIEKLTGSIPKNILNAVKGLVEKRLIIKIVKGPIGKQVTYYDMVVNEDSNNSYPCRDDTPTPVKSIVETPVKLTVTKERLQNKENIKGNVKGPDAAKTLPLKKEHGETLELLKSCDLGGDDEALKFLIRTYSKEKILDALNHLRKEVEKGTKFKKEKIAFFRHCLSGKASVITQRCSKNKERLLEALNKNPWDGLEIHEKFVICKETFVEIPFDLEKEAFDEKINNLYKIYG